MSSVKKFIIVSLFLVAAGLPVFSIDPITITPDGHILVNANGVSIDLVEYLVPVGSIQLFGGSTPPSGWALCNGHAVLSAEHQYDRLYAIIGTTFGNGTTEDGHTAGGYFNLPDLREAAPVGAGSRVGEAQDYDE